MDRTETDNVTGFSFKVAVLPATRLYTYWRRNHGKISTVHIGAYFGDGTGEDGTFAWETAQELLIELNLPDLEGLLSQDKPAFAHVAYLNGLLGIHTLYGISVREDSKVYLAELRRNELFPQWQD